MQTAVFVDAGYLYAASSVLITGQRQPRHAIFLDVSAALAALAALQLHCAPNTRLLRIYWYDGLSRNGRLSSEQEQVANAPYTKLRLGVVNSSGEQKGVDSLIVTDLIDLSRNRAITNAVILSGDEDIRVGVQIAQTFGVQIHLLGIKPVRGNQSPDLIYEADTHHEWDDDLIGRLVTVTPVAVAETTGAKTNSTLSTARASDEDQFMALALRAIEDTMGTLDQPNLDRALKTFAQGGASVPPELDRPTLARLRALLARDLADHERKAYRDRFRQYLREW